MTFRNGSFKAGSQMYYSGGAKLNSSTFLNIIWPIFGKIQYYSILFFKAWKSLVLHMPDGMPFLYYLHCHQWKKKVSLWNVA